MVVSAPQTQAARSPSQHGPSPASPVPALSLVAAGLCPATLAGFTSVVPLCPMPTLVQLSAQSTRTASGEKSPVEQGPHTPQVVHTCQGQPHLLGFLKSLGSRVLWDCVALDLWSCWILGHACVDGNGATVPGSRSHKHLRPQGGFRGNPSVTGQDTCPASRTSLPQHSHVHGQRLAFSFPRP